MSSLAQGAPAVGIRAVTSHDDVAGQWAVARALAWRPVASLLAIRLAIYWAIDGHTGPHVPDECTVVTCDNITAPHQTNVCRATTEPAFRSGHGMKLPTGPLLQNCEWRGLGPNRASAASWKPSGDAPGRLAGQQSFRSTPFYVPG